MTTLPRSIDRGVDLLAQLTTADKVALLAGETMWTTTPVPRLGIPALKVTDGPNGARGGGSLVGGAMTSACFPAGIALAATWNTGLVEQVGEALGQEARSKGGRMLLGPTVNIHRSPLNGRNFECFSEDPFLSARTTVAYITGLQREGVGATVKHFVGNDSEFQRNTISSDIDERTLREVYLPPFEAAVREAGTWGVMAGYNRLNGTYAGEHEWLLRDLLKGEWAFDGILMSDWYGTQSTVDAANNGMDLEMPGPPLWRGEKLLAAVEHGDVRMEAIDEAAGRVLRLLDRAGAFTAPEIPEERSEDRPEHRALIRRAAAEGAVLLKNEGDLLPLSADRISSIAVIGPNALRPAIHGGGSAQVNAPYVSSPLDAIRARADESIRVEYELGCPNHQRLPRIDPELLGPDAISVAYFNNLDLSGEPVVTLTSPSSEQAWLGRMDPAVDARQFSARLTATLTPRESGTHRFSLISAGKARFAIDGKELIDTWTDQTLGEAYFGFGTTEEFEEVELEAGRPHHLTVEYSSEGARLKAVRLGHLPPLPVDGLDRAAALAARADVAIVIAGTNGDWESEGYDRADMDLPGRQNELIARVAAANPRTVVVLQTGSPVTMPWLDAVPAVLQTWFAGQECGNATADLLFGDATPSGKLPQTFPVRLEDNPAFINYPGDNGHVRYGEGIFVGYRYYEKKKVAPLFPFGFGLSYTSFAYGEPRLDKTALTADDTLTVTLDVTNTGGRAGQEIVQLYVRDPESSVARPEKELKGFAKVSLQPGETKSVTITLDRRAFAFWHDGEHAWVVESGAFELLIGSSSADIRAQATVMVVG